MVSLLVFYLGELGLIPQKIEVIFPCFAILLFYFQMPGVFILFYLCSRNYVLLRLFPNFFIWITFLHHIMTYSRKTNHVVTFFFWKLIKHCNDICLRLSDEQNTFLITWNTIVCYFSLFENGKSNNYSKQSKKSTA